MKSRNRPVSYPLNLRLPMKGGTDCGPEKIERLANLMAALKDRAEGIEDKLRDLRHIHFARFLPTHELTSPSDDAAIQVITEFDGPLEAYVLDFAMTIADDFDVILAEVEGWPTPGLPPNAKVQDYPQEFMEFIRRHDIGLRTGTWQSDFRLFSAYPEKTVLDIIGPDKRLAQLIEHDPTSVDPNDVQANVLRSVNAEFASHRTFRFGSMPDGQQFLRELLNPSKGGLVVTADKRTSEDNRPSYFLTVGLTYSGLQILGLSDEDKQAFDTGFKTFVLGPGNPLRCASRGDVGDSAPGRWRLRDDFHILVSLYTDTVVEQTSGKSQLEALSLKFKLESVWVQDAAAKGPRKARELHFGYVDGISEPKLDFDGLEAQSPPDRLNQVNPGTLLLGAYRNAYGGKSTRNGLSAALSTNGCFGALRVLSQDVTAFNRLLDEAAVQCTTAGFNAAIAQGYANAEARREWIAAKIMGRWRNGKPLQPIAATGGLNDFDYAPSTTMNFPDDFDGAVCPMGTHVRRANPRSARVTGRPYSRRLFRRGMPYSNPPEGSLPEEVGLFGLFLCADLERQFEFIVEQWLQGGDGAPGIHGQQDPVTGAQCTLGDGRDMHGTFSIPILETSGDINFRVPRLTKTVGAAYLFFPGMEGLRHLAGRPPSSPAPSPGGNAQVSPKGKAAAPPAAPLLFNPETFDPDRSSAFLDAPNDFYTAWRNTNTNPDWVRTPLLDEKGVKCIWAIGGNAAKKVGGAPKDFRKRALHVSDDEATQMLNMDPPAYDVCRPAVEAVFDKFVKAKTACIEKCVSTDTTSELNALALNSPIDWIAAVAKPLSEQAFFSVFGLSTADSEELVASSEKALSVFSVHKASDRSFPLTLEVGNTLFLLHRRLKDRSTRPAGAFWTLMEDARRRQDNGELAYDQQGTRTPTMEMLAIAASLVLSGFLPLRWAIGLATYHLLRDIGTGATLLEQLRAADSTALSTETAVDFLLRYDSAAPMATRSFVGQLDGQTSPENYRVVMAWGAANRDGWPPGPLDLADGKKGAAWTFGDGHLHDCLGRELTYAVLIPYIDALRKSTVPIKLQDGWKPRFEPSSAFRILSDLMVTA